MIVAMKKVSLIVLAKDAENTVKKLRKLGVLHIEHQQLPQGKEIISLKDDLSILNNALAILQEDEFRQSKIENRGGEPENWQFIAKHIIELHKRFDQLNEYQRILKSRISQWQEWGDFDADQIKALGLKGIYLKLYQLPPSELKKIPEGIILKKISASKGIVRCVAISHEIIDLPFKEIELPKMRLSILRSRLNKDAQVIVSIKKGIIEYSDNLSGLRQVKKRLEKEFEFYQALKGMGQQGEIAYLAGYAPFDSVPTLLEVAGEERWGISISDPAESDQVPTLLRNPRWVSIINPVFKLLEVVPGYQELDISLWFLLFLSVFFGMLIGDAGYGLIFFILTLWAHRRWAKKLKDKSVFPLFYLFSLCAIIWGVLSGTFFGQEWLAQRVPALVPALRNNKNIQAICFFIGALHLSIGHLWRLILKAPALIALADAGWILILWGAFFLAKALILGDYFPGFANWFFILGPVLVVFFASPDKNILKGIGKGSGQLLLNLVNSFTDIVSYIRLFAVGLATVAVADAFNSMALSIGFKGIISGLVTTFILLVGHSLNIMLGPMAVLVHGVRLNVLEFSNHVGVKWSGLTYRPLQEERV